MSYPSKREREYLENLVRDREGTIRANDKHLRSEGTLSVVIVFEPDEYGGMAVDRVFGPFDTSLRADAFKAKLPEELMFVFELKKAEEPMTVTICMNCKWHDELLCTDRCTHSTQRRAPAGVNFVTGNKLYYRTKEEKSQFEFPECKRVNMYGNCPMYEDLRDGNATDECD